MLNITYSKNKLKEFLIESTSGSSLLAFDKKQTNYELYSEINNIKFLKYVRKSISTLLVFSTFYTSAFAKPPSYYRFTKDIYDQDEKINSLRQINPNISEEEIDKELQSELINRKEKELEKNCLERIKSDINLLKNNLFK